MSAEKNKPTWSEEIAKFFDEKLNTFQVRDKVTADELLKLGLEETKKGHGHRTKAKKILGKALVNHNISIADKGFKKEIGGFKINLVKAELPSMDSQFQTQPKIMTSADAQTGKSPLGGVTAPPSGALPAPTTTGEKSVYEKYIDSHEAPKTARPQLPAGDEKNYEHLFKYGTELLAKVYIQTGIVQSEEVPEKPEPMKAEEWSNELDKFGQNIAHYCFRKNIPIPTFIEMFLLGCEGFFVLGAPLIMFFLAGRKSKSKTKEQDTTLDNVGEKKVSDEKVGGESTE